MLPVSSTTSSGPPVVLVHGMYHGGWCWRPVAEALRATGVVVYTPTLTGVGERSHLLSPAVGFDTHVRDVIALLECEGLSDVMLVGHSYGGSVVHKVADLVPERMSQVVYLDSTHFDIDQLAPDDLPRPPSDPRPYGPDNVLCYPVPSDTTRWGIKDADVLAWFLPRLSPQPARTRSDGRGFSSDPLHGIPRTYIACLLDAWGRPIAESVRPVWERVRGHPLFDFREIAAPHEVLITDPRTVADLLLDVRSRVHPRQSLAKVGDHGIQTTG